MTPPLVFALWPFFIYLFILHATLHASNEQTLTPFFLHVSRIGCHYSCHKKCSELVYNNCIRSMYIPSADDLSRHSSMTAASTASSSPRSTLSPRRANTDGMRVSIPPAIVSSSQPLQSLVERPSTRSQKKDQDQQDPQKDTTPPAAGRTKFLEDAIISAAIRMSLPGDISALPKNDHPALSIQATTINFTRFVHKTTGLFWFQDQVEDILTWKDPWNTTFVLVLYCFVCKYHFSVLSKWPRK